MTAQTTVTPTTDASGSTLKATETPPPGSTTSEARSTTYPQPKSTTEGTLIPTTDPTFLPTTKPTRSQSVNPGSTSSLAPSKTSEVSKMSSAKGSTLILTSPWSTVSEVPGSNAPRTGWLLCYTKYGRQVKYWIMNNNFHPIKSNNLLLNVWILLIKNTQIV